jgi:hypothetical protein
MTARFRDRYDPSEIRFTRLVPGSDRNQGLLKVLDSVLPGGSVFHVFADTPDQSEDLFVVLIDGTTMVRFDLPRDCSCPGIGAGPPSNVEIEPFAVVRERAGQEQRKLLDRAALDAHHLLA